MNKFEFTAGVIAAALAFRDKVGEQEEKESLDLVNKGQDSDEALEHAEESLTRQFSEFIHSGNPVGMLLKRHPFADDLRCLAAAKTGEPTFTLRGQDITAPAVVRNWVEMQGLNPDAGSEVWRKVDKAAEIATKMEAYEDRKWAD